MSEEEEESVLLKEVKVFLKYCDSYLDVKIRLEISNLNNEFWGEK